ncbi:MAG: SMI1/KNR4 family protein [Gammaproteobacteria bacterium]|nr:SMI1/KNR4 family protein [Gammaproteobacteria bacterium]
MNKISLLEASRALFSEIESTSPQISKIKHYLSEGADINYQSENDGYTALMLTVDKDDEPLVAYLLQEGANPLIQNHHHEIASSLASSHSTIYQILKNYELLFGAQQNDINTVNAALDAGANINFQRKDGYTAILIAVEKNLLKMVELLLKKGADINLKDNVHRGVFDLATEDPIWELLRRERPLPDDDTHIAVSIEEPFSVAQLEIFPIEKNFKPAPSKEEFKTLEEHYKHSIPPSLKEIFLNYNGGRPKLNQIRNDESKLISFFYTLNEQINSSDNIWNIINNYSDILGPETLPFAKGLYNEIFFLKWVDGKEQVWSFLYGDIALETFDEDETEEWDGHSMPTTTYFLADSIDDFLRALHYAD